MIDDRDRKLLPPPECIRWCAAQDRDVVVADDMATVDLDWWNHRLRRADIPVELTGRNPDGDETRSGTAVLRRGDLARDTADLPMRGDDALVVLYRCAAWLCEHPDRHRRRTFPDVRDRAPITRTRLACFERIVDALRACAEMPNLIDGGPFREWSGWPTAPGAGHSLLTLYSWAVHPGALRRPQLLDQAAVAMFVRLNWTATPAVTSFRPRDYQRYNDLLHWWADRAGTVPELIELWLSNSWRNLDRVNRRVLRP